jgi:hypothetical protein
LIIPQYGLTFYSGSLTSSVLEFIHQRIQQFCRLRDWNERPLVSPRHHAGRREVLNRLFELHQVRMKGRTDRQE